MEPSPPPLTPEHIEGLFALLAEAGAVGLRKVTARLEAAETDEAVERMTRSLQTVGRHLRQTLALKQRFDRDQIALTAERRVHAEVERKDAQRAQRDANFSHYMDVRGHFERVLWTEYEDDDAQELFEELDTRLGEFSDEPGFLDIPVETLITRMAFEFDLPAEGKGPRHMKPGAKPPAPKAAQPAPQPPPAQPPAVQPSTAVSDTDYEPDWSDPPRAQLPVTDPLPPEPYIPPWERGIVRRGGSGW